LNKLPVVLNAKSPSSKFVVGSEDATLYLSPKSFTVPILLPTVLTFPLEPPTRFTLAISVATVPMVFVLVKLVATVPIVFAPVKLEAIVLMLAFAPATVEILLVICPATVLTLAISSATVSTKEVPAVLVTASAIEPLSSI
jgi:hypothetical protein